MADNLTTQTTVATVPSGTVIATDDVGGVHYQRVKLTAGAADSVAAIDGDATNGLDVDVTRVIPGTGATNLGKAEDAAHASGDVGVMVLGVRRSTPTDLSAGATNGDYEPFQVDANGRVWVNAYLTANTSGTDLAINGTYTPGAGGGTNTITAQSMIGLPVNAALLVYNGSAWTDQRTPTVFKTVSLGAATAETTIWTPAAGKKFRLMGFLLTCGGAATLTFKDNTAGSTIAIARGTTDTPIPPPPLGNGILSAAANNVLTVTRSASVTLDGMVFGTEE